MDLNNYHRIMEQCKDAKATLVAVSKTKPVEDIKALYDAGHRDFGENKVQEMEDKQPQLPEDIHWHAIGHLQRNKVKYLASYVHLIHSIDSLKLLKEVNKRAGNEDRKVRVLLQMHIAEESSKFGLDNQELEDVMNYCESENPEHFELAGMMGMATFTDDHQQVEREFKGLRKLFEDCRADERTNKDRFTTLSMGMSGDYEIALACGSNMIRVGSLIFGERNY